MDANVLVVQNSIVRATRLRVPYVSQNGPGATLGIGDCGLACVTALVRSKGINLSVDSVGQSAGLMQGYRSANVLTLKRAANLFGVTLAWSGWMLAEELVREINDGRAVILLVWYPALRKKRLASYQGGHFILVHGYEQTGAGLHFFYDDPEWFSAREGEDIRISASELMAAAWHPGPHARTPGQGLTLRGHRLAVVEPQTTTMLPARRLVPESEDHRG